MSAPRTSNLVRGAATMPLYSPPRLLRPDAVQAASLLESARRQIVSAEQESARITGDAREQAQRILDSAQRQVAEAVSAAGEDARAAAIEDSRELMRSLQRETERIGAELAAYAQRAGWLIAAAILKAELSTRPQLVIDIVSKTITEARLYKKLIVCVHPDDLPLIQAHEPHLQSLAAIASVFRVRADNSIPRGGVRIDTEMGSFDGSLTARLQQIGQLTGTQPTSAQPPEAGAAG